MNWPRNALGLASGAALGSGAAGMVLRGRMSPDAPYSPQDSDTVKEFIAHTKGWTPEADPREMIHDYSNIGHRASNVTVAGKNLGDIAELGHSAPSLSKWDSAYRNHYDQFEHGPLSAYNVRADEFQNMFGLKNKDTGMTLDDVLGGARTGQMPNHPEYTPALAKLHQDIDASGAQPRADFGDLHSRVLGHQQEIAQAHGFGSDLSKLTPDQQSQVLQELNPHLLGHNPQDYADNQLMETLMGYDVPRAGSAYGMVGHGVEAAGHTMNAAHDVGQFASDHAEALMGGGGAGLLLSLLNSRNQPEKTAMQTPALEILQARSA